MLIKGFVCWDKSNGSFNNFSLRLQSYPIVKISVWFGYFQQYILLYYHFVLLNYFTGSFIYFILFCIQYMFVFLF